MKQLSSKVKSNLVLLCFLRNYNVQLYTLCPCVSVLIHMDYFRNAFICKYFLLINLHNNYRLSFTLILSFMFLFYITLNIR